MNARHKANKSKHGFTLVELIIVIAILAILAGIAIPAFSSAIGNAQSATCLTNRGTLKRILSMAYVTGGEEKAAEEYTSYSQKYLCPAGGEVTYTLDKDTGIVTVTCSVHKDESEETPEQKTTRFNSALGALYQLFVNSGVSYNSVDSSAKDTPGKYAYQFYNSLTPEQRKTLDSYEWSITKTTSGIRVVFAEKSTIKTDGTFGIYKYIPETNEYQYTPQGKVTNGNLNSGVTSWGIYDENGNWIKDGRTAILPSYK